MQHYIFVLFKNWEINYSLCSVKQDWCFDSTCSGLINKAQYSRVQGWEFHSQSSQTYKMDVPLPSLVGGYNKDSYQNNLTELEIVSWCRRSGLGVSECVSE